MVSNFGLLLKAYCVILEILVFIMSRAVSFNQQNGEFNLTFYKIGSDRT